MTLSKLVAQHLGTQPDTGYGAMTLTHYTPGTVNPTNVTAGNAPTSVTYPCRGRLGSLTSTTVVAGQFVRVSKPVVVILRDSLPAAIRPQVGDTVTRAGVVYRVTEGGSSNGGSEVTYECAISAPGG
jgi:hypothetical protein